jgi:uncharacterized protein YbaR (Trm112 family)
MTCSCPKCHAQIEVDLTNIPEKGTFNPCPECKGRFWINRESYARMALKKDGETYCDKCGIVLDHKIVCTSCGVMYPDFFLVQASRPPRRQVEKLDLLSLSFTLRPAQPTSTYTYTPSAREHHIKTPRPRPILKTVGIAALLILLAFGINYFYNLKKSEQQFAKNYMRALYTITSGTDLSLKICTKTSSDWKMTGQSSAPRIREEDATRLNSVKELTDRFMQTLDNPPNKFIVSKEKLAKLYDVYSKTTALAVAPSGSLAGFTSSADKSQSDFNVAVQELKRSLPPELSSELQIAKVKYKSLQEI